MLFLLPDIVSCLLTLLHWYENNTVLIVVQFSSFLHSNQAQNTSSGMQGQEATAIAVI